MAFFNNKRRDFSIQPPNQDVSGLLTVTDSANIDFTYSNNNLTANLTTTGILAGTYGSSTDIPVIQLDIYGRVIGITTIPISSLGITLETNGVTNGDQTLLNLVAGTNMTITDDGFGNITFDATGGGGTYTVDNGLTENPATNFQLGGTLIQNTSINLDGIYEFSIAGSNILSSTGRSLLLRSTPSEYAFTIGDVDDVLGYTQAVGFTNTFQVLAGVNTGIDLNFGALNYKFGQVSNNGDWNYIEVSALSGGSFSHWGLDILSTLRRNFNIDAQSGALTFDNYGSGLFTGTLAYALGVNSSGDVIEYTPSTPTTGDSISPFLLMGG